MVAPPGHPSFWVVLKDVFGVSNFSLAPYLLGRTSDLTFPTRREGVVSLSLSPLLPLPIPPVSPCHPPSLLSPVHPTPVDAPSPPRRPDGRTKRHNLGRTLSLMDLHPQRPSTLPDRRLVENLHREPRMDTKGHVPLSTSYRSPRTIPVSRGE